MLLTDIRNCLLQFDLKIRNESISKGIGTVRIEFETSGIMEKYKNGLRRCTNAYVADCC